MVSAFCAALTRSNTHHTAGASTTRAASAGFRYSSPLKQVGIATKKKFKKTRETREVVERKQNWLGENPRETRQKRGSLSALNCRHAANFGCDLCLGLLFDIRIQTLQGQTRSPARLSASRSLAVQDPSDIL